jgi:hypothetical protein
LTIDATGDNLRSIKFSWLTLRNLTRAQMEEVNIIDIPHVPLLDCCQNGCIDLSALPEDKTIQVTLELYKEQ